MIINGNFEIVTEDRNVVLRKYIEPTEKFKTIDGIKEFQGMSRGNWELQGYYPSLQAALRGYVNAEVRSVPRDILDLQRKLDEVLGVIEGVDELSFSMIAQLEYELRDARKAEISDAS